jgi:acetyltransferase-like isoleucine patch superfamily enzyme
MLRRIANLLSKIYLYSLCFLRTEISRKGRVTVKGIPIVELAPGSRVDIGKNVTLNSSNRKYHINMFAPVKLVADVKGACITIGDNTRVHGSCIHAKREIRIGSRCLIAANSNIIDSNGHDLCFDDVLERQKSTGKAEPIVVEDDVWIGAGCLVLPGTHIGRGSVIASGSVVKGVIPPYSLVASPKSVIVRQYESD